MNDKGREFKGIYGGASYDRMAKIMGMRSKFYRRIIGGLDLQENMRVLDLGCGTGSLGVAFSEFCQGKISIDGIDISEDQLNYAREKTQVLEGDFCYHKCSMDDLIFDDERFDIVVASMALHETPPEVRRGAIKEVARVLKPSGRFVLVEWAKPRFGLMGLVWLPFLFFGHWKDNWKNRYVDICAGNGLKRCADYYFNSLMRRQEFIKE